MNKVVVTTCSLNHLAQAKSMGDSLIRYNPDYKLIIGLVDKLNDRVRIDQYSPHEIVEAHTLNIPEFEDMSKRYTPLELNCALKSFYCSYTFEKYSAGQVIFLDSDILVYDSLQYLEHELETNSILITPHITVPFPEDGRRPVEKEMLKNGVFNAGFFAVKNNNIGNSFLNWFKKRMIGQAYVNAKEGLNADQTWFNLVPLYFDEVFIVKHAGCNVAYWNLHEREVTKKGKNYFVNKDFPLLFFHFSGYSLQFPGKLSRHQDRIDISHSGVLQELVKQYHDSLLKNDHPKMLLLENVYSKKNWKKKLKKILKK